MPNTRFPFQEFTMKVNNGKMYGLIIETSYKAFDKFPLDKPSFKEQAREQRKGGVRGNIIQCEELVKS